MSNPTPSMYALILNRQFQHPTDGWYMIDPAGEHFDPESKTVFVVDNRAVAAMAARFNTDADKPRFPGMLIDHEHFRHQPDKESVAYGWLMHTQPRANGLFGKIHWTNTGKPAVDGADYRWFATEYDPELVEVCDRRQGSIYVRPLRIDGLTVTNAPANLGGLPIRNRIFWPIQPGTILHQNQVCQDLGAAMRIIRDRDGCDWTLALKTARKEFHIPFR